MYATGTTLEQCRENFREVIEEWFLLTVRRDLPIPDLGGVSSPVRHILRDYWLSLRYYVSRNYDKLPLPCNAGSWSAMRFLVYLLWASWLRYRTTHVMPWTQGAGFGERVEEE